MGTRAICPRTVLGVALVTALGLAAGPTARAASALTPAPAALDLRAADGLDAATATARGWQADAVPVHVEAADSLHDDGSAAAWAYVFWSPQARLARSYTVRHDGTVAAVDLAFPFDPPPVESGWSDATGALERLRKDPRLSAGTAFAHLVSAVLSRGLVQSGSAGRDALPRTAWLLGFAPAGAAPGAELVIDALRGTVLERRTATPAEAADSPAGTIAGGRKDLPPWLAAHATLALARLGSVRDRDATSSRARWLTAREGASMARLSAQDAELDSLARAPVGSTGAGLDQRLAALAAWRAAGASADSALVRSASRIDACLRDLVSETPTAIAVYLSVTDHARPARVSVLVDGVEAARATYGDAEWRALDAGTWAELARLTVRPGARTVQVDVESADHRIDHATWQAEVTRGQWSVLHLSLSGAKPQQGAAPRLDFLSQATP